MERGRAVANSGATNHGVRVIVVFISSSRIVVAALTAQPYRIDREFAEGQAFSDPTPARPRDEPGASSLSYAATRAPRAA
jgi:hypothetical protein